jgi:multimeric flavodoxin WrbA
MSQVSQPQILGIVGSPRRNGNTEILIDEVLRGAEEAGASVEKVILTRLKISPCTGCDECQEEGKCIFRDDMESLFTKMGKSSVWVLGTPVYWWGPTAQFKAFLDRWYAKIFRSEDAALFRGKRVILVIPMGDTDAKTARHTVGMFQDALNYVRAEIYATVLATNVNDRGEVREQADLLTEAYQIGLKALEARQ